MKKYMTVTVPENGCGTINSQYNYDSIEAGITSLGLVDEETLEVVIEPSRNIIRIDVLSDEDFIVTKYEIVNDNNHRSLYHKQTKTYLEYVNRYGKYAPYGCTVFNYAKGFEVMDEKIIKLKFPEGERLYDLNLCFTTSEMFSYIYQFGKVKRTGDYFSNQDSQENLSVSQENESVAQAYVDIEVEVDDNVLSGSLYCYINKTGKIISMIYNSVTCRYYPPTEFNQLIKDVPRQLISKYLHEKRQEKERRAMVLMHTDYRRGDKNANN